MPLSQRQFIKFITGACVLLPAALCSMVFSLQAATYEVGPGKIYESIGEVSWEGLNPGDTVLIYWRSTPYHEKWVICRQGSAAAPITVRGIPGPSGELPIIDGDGATTRAYLDYWNEVRGVLKIGGASKPPDTVPKHVVIENLEIRNGGPSYSFTADNGSIQSYADNAAAIYIEKGENITIRNCILHDSVDLSIQILTDEGKPLHVNKLVQLLQQRFGRLTDRDSLSSSLAKKARQGILLRQTAAATFAVMDSKEDNHVKA